ncbi:MAG: bifunctional (p)ppGpp synthetase/guanosine-3',5'-bis(diphosphate) 3'-pyrophosphohydrolase, partial [Nitrospirota bacterium]
TEIGDHCVGAKINGKLVPLRYRLTSGDMIDILTSSSQVPHKGWLKFVRTSRARTKIKHWFKVEENKRALEIGHRLLERECRRHGLPVSQTLKSDALLAKVKENGYETIDEMTRMVGYGRLSAARIINLLAPPSPTTPKESVAESSVTPKKTPKTKEERSVKVKGGNDVLMQLSKCCNPVPGDQIMGYITRGRGLTIHSVGCPNLQALDWDQNRLVEAEWDSGIYGTHSVKVSVLTVDRTGVLADISAAISECQANITRAEISTREDRKAVLDFVIEITNTLHLERMLNGIERVDGVITAKRVRGW